MQDHATINRHQLFQLLDSGTHVVTGNTRLANSLQNDYQQHVIAGGSQAWKTPAIQSWNVWLRKLWQDAVYAGLIPSPVMLLTEEQQQLVWESIIETSDYGLLRTEATAANLCEAWKTACDWKLDIRQSAFDANEDTREFQRWAVRFEDHCRENDWLPAARMTEQLAGCMMHGTELLAERIVFTGFDELTPSRRELLAAIENSGCKVQWAELLVQDRPPGASNVVRVACTDSGAEIDTLARWCRQKLGDDPAASIGIVVPDLSAHREKIIRGLSAALDPSRLVDDRNVNELWNLSLGLPLSRHLLVETALLLLELAGGKCTLEQAGQLLLSPYLEGAEQELASRALLDRQLRDVGENTISVGRLAFWSGMHDRPWYCPLLQQRLADLEKHIAGVPGAATTAGWSHVFSGILIACGWARGRNITSTEYQAAEACNKLLMRFSGLQAISGRIAYSRALSMLKRMARVQIFQPRTGYAPIQVLGFYEAIGQHFDHLWLMDMHDARLPASPRPNPFIPLQLQRDLGMPHADHERELKVAGQVLDRLLASGHDIVVSYPVHADEEELRPSPLVEHLPLVPGESLHCWNGPDWMEQVRQSRVHELLSLDVAPALGEQRASGGSGIFKYQSLCPFRAFAEYRLAARELATAQVGLDTMKRGQLFHKVLELFWQQTGDLSTLNSMNEHAVSDRLDAVIEQAIELMAEKAPGLFTPRFRRIEASRLKELAIKWLEIERQRSEFRVIEFEKEVEADINGIRVHLWIDRVDQLPDGRKAVIDYKTGKVNATQWFGERPEEPQLPLYSMVEGEGVCAVLFAQVRADEMKFSGVVEEAGLVPSLPPGRKGPLQEATDNWPQVLLDWEQSINRLAADFRDGRAEVDPREEKTCETSYCKLAGLCRIDELRTGDGHD